MYVLLIFLLVTTIQAQIQNQNQCACSCCIGSSCIPQIVGMVNVQNCSAEICLSQCRCTYPQCSGTYPYGQLLSQCTTPISTFNCQCLCCNTGFASCTPLFVGYTTAYQCQVSACSIACADQYPAQCVSNLYGQTQGSCIGAVTTTTAMTTVVPWLGNICSCSYCQSGYTCSSSTLVGVASVSTCSSSDCTLACQNRYPTTCSSAYLSQISGMCLIQGSGRTRCKCNCCGGSGCIDYELNSNDTCTASCYSKCAQVSPCTNTRTITYTCAGNHSIITVDFFLLIFIIGANFFLN